MPLLLKTLKLRVPFLLSRGKSSLISTVSKGFHELRFPLQRPSLPRYTLSKPTCSWVPSHTTYPSSDRFLESTGPAMWIWPYSKNVSRITFSSGLPLSSVLVYGPMVGSDEDIHPAWHNMDMESSGWPRRAPGNLTGIHVTSYAEVPEFTSHVHTA